MRALLRPRSRHPGRTADRAATERGATGAANDDRTSVMVRVGRLGAVWLLAGACGLGCSGEDTVPASATENDGGAQSDGDPSPDGAGGHDAEPADGAGG